MESFLRSNLSWVAVGVEFSSLILEYLSVEHSFWSGFIPPITLTHEASLSQAVGWYPWRSSGYVLGRYSVMASANAWINCPRTFLFLTAVFSTHLISIFKAWSVTVFSLASWKPIEHWYSNMHVLCWLGQPLLKHVRDGFPAVWWYVKIMFIFIVVFITKGGL